MIAKVRAAGVATISLVLVVVAASTVRAQAPAPANVVSLKVSRETAPPGGIAQMKIFITEPKPITSGRAFIEFDAFSDIEGIALAPGDAAGVAVVQGGRIALSIVSPGGTFGTEPDYPGLTIAGRVPATAPVGLLIPMVIDPAALLLVDPSGTPYPVEVKAGYLVSGGVLSISDVVPGSADIEAGGVVTIFGSGFRPDTKVRVKDTLLAEVRYVSPNRLDIVLATPAHIHGMRIRVRNKDDEEVNYVAYHRTRRAGATADPVLQDVVPVFPHTSSDSHVIDTSTSTAGIALQNLDGADTFVFAGIADASGRPLAAGYLEIPSNTYVVCSLAEIFGFTPTDSAVVTLAATNPLQVLGVDVDAEGRATPRLPR